MKRGRLFRQPHQTLPLGFPWFLVNHDSDAEPEIVLRCAGKRSELRITIASEDRVPIELCKADVDVLVDPQIEPATERHCEVRGVDIEDDILALGPEEGRASTLPHWIYHKDIPLTLKRLLGPADENMCKWLKLSAVLPIIFDLDTAEELADFLFELKLLGRRIEYVLTVCVSGIGEFRSDVS